MPRYVITGRVHPERADISFARVPMKLGDSGEAVASCESSQISVSLNSPDVDGWITAKIVAEDVATIMVGALGFSLGCGYSVELIQVTEEDGTPHVFGVQPEGPAAGETLGFHPHVEVFNRAFRLSGRDVFFRLAVRDYLQAINDVTDCALYCYRAIEAIKGAFALKSGFDRWDEMHNALGTDRDTITSTIKDYADPVRHGNWMSAKPTDSLIRWRMLALTREILTKYLNLEQPTL